MLHRLGHLACAIAFLAICGGHWAVLQTVAWTQMLRDYSAESGLVTAIQQTFSGDRPCSMCVNITKERQKESQSPAMLALAKKFELLGAFAAIRAEAPPFRSLAYPRPASLSFPTRSDAPPVPVPIV